MEVGVASGAALLAGFGTVQSPVIVDPGGLGSCAELVLAVLVQGNSRVGVAEVFLIPFEELRVVCLALVEGVGVVTVGEGDGLALELFVEFAATVGLAAKGRAADTGAVHREVDTVVGEGTEELFFFQGVQTDFSCGCGDEFPFENGKRNAETGNGLDGIAIKDDADHGGVVEIDLEGSLVVFTEFSGIHLFPVLENIFECGVVFFVSCPAGIPDPRGGGVFFQQRIVGPVILGRRGERAERKQAEDDKVFHDKVYLLGCRKISRNVFLPRLVSYLDLGFVALLVPLLQGVSSGEGVVEKVEFAAGDLVAFRVDFDLAGAFSEGVGAPAAVLGFILRGR